MKRAVKEIVQLDKYEYERLMDMANTNQDQINNRAIELFKENSYLRAELYVSTGQGFTDNIRKMFKTTSYVKNGNETFKIADTDLKRLAGELEYAMTDYMVKRYGTGIKNYRKMEQEISMVKRVRNIFIGITLLGWLVAILTTLIIFLR